MAAGFAENVSKSNVVYGTVDLILQSNSTVPP